MNQSEILAYVEQEFKDGSKYLSDRDMKYDFKHSDEIEIKLDSVLVPVVDPIVHLLSPFGEYHQRNLQYAFIEELIQKFDQIREGYVSPKILAVLETLLLALDYLTHERFAYASVKDGHREELRCILDECFERKKNHTFSKYAGRAKLNQARMYEREGKIYCRDERENKNRVYMAIVYKKAENFKDHFKQIGYQLGKIKLAPNADPNKVSYEDYCNGKTEHNLHVDLLFFLSMIQRALSWFLNCSSWRDNELWHYDEMELRSKLGIR